jgi:hypothetical protein
MIFQQAAFRAGALTASLPTMTVAKPVVAGALGVILLGETFDVEGAEVFVLIAAVAMVIVATVGLARGEAASMAAGAGQDRIIADPHSDFALSRAGAGDAAAADGAGSRAISPRPVGPT